VSATRSRGRGIRWSGAALVAALVCVASPALATPISGLVLSEIMFEPAGNDNGREWVEIYNGTGAVVDLSQYSLSWGRNSLANSVNLAAVMLAPGDVFIIGGPTSDANNSNPVYDQIFNFGPDLYDGNHGNQEDAVALIYNPTATLMHIVVYGGNGVVTAFTDEQGAVATAVDSSGVGQGDSFEYLGSGIWQAQAVPTPGAPAATLPEPSTALLCLLGLLSLGVASGPRVSRG